MLRFPAIALLLLALTACGSLQDIVPGGLKAGAPASNVASESEDAWLDRLADQIINADTPEGRALRMCFFNATAAELYTFRLTYYGSPIDEKRTAYGAVLSIQNSVQKLHSQSDPLWFETDMFYAGVDLIRAVEGPLRDRALGLATNAAGQNWKGLARSLREGAGQGFLASAMFRDARHAADALEANSLDMKTAWASCEGRIQRNLDILSGAIGVAAPMPLRITP